MNDPHLATREVLWNIGHAWVMYALLLPTLAIAAYGIYARVRIWRRGQAENRWDRPLARIALVAKYALLQLRTWRKLYPGLMHAMIFWGFIVLTIATTVVMLDYDFGIHIMHGYFYLVFQSFITDVFGALAIVGLGMAAARRWVARPKELVYSREASIILVAIFAILVSGFLVEGWRIAATDDPWAAWSPFGNLVARLMRADVSRSNENRPRDDLVATSCAGLWLSGLGRLHQDGPRAYVDLEHLHSAAGADRRKPAKGRLRIRRKARHPLPCRI